MKAEIVASCTGWKDSKWMGGFFPEDIPDDWRVDYYCNEFSAIYLESADCFDESFVEGLEECMDEELQVFMQSETYSQWQELHDSADLTSNALNIILLEPFVADSKFPDLYSAAIKSPTHAELEGETGRNESVFLFNAQTELTPKELRALAEHLLQYAGAEAHQIDIFFSDSKKTIENCNNLYTLSQLL